MSLDSQHTSAAFSQLRIFLFFMVGGEGAKKYAKEPF